VSGVASALELETVGLMSAEKPRWRVVCSCGWEREASSAWAATASVQLHVRHLGAPGTEHALTVEEPPADAPPGEQLPLV
jgi:hypothetical protein